MMMWNEKREANFRMVKIMAWAMMVVIPIILLGMTYVVEAKPQTGGQVDMMFYILLILSVFQPMISPMIERMQIDNYKKNQQSQMTPDQLFFNLGMIRGAFVEAIFLYGLLNFFLSGDLTRMLYFYPIGIVWSFFRWPKRSAYEEFIQKIEANIL